MQAAIAGRKKTSSSIELRLPLTLALILTHVLSLASIGNARLSQGGASKSTYTTSGAGLLVQFHSSSGSLAGSSINYGFDVRRLLPEKKPEPADANWTEPAVPAEDMSTDSFSLLQPQELDKSKTVRATASASSRSIACGFSIFLIHSLFTVMTVFICH